MVGIEAWGRAYARAVLDGQRDFYDEASVYDILHTPGTGEEVDGLERLVRRVTGRRASSFFEPACGSGRYLRVLGGRGYRAVGVDINPRMVAYANDRLRRLGLHRRVRVIEAPMESFASLIGCERFDAAFNLINTIRHLPSDRVLLAHFAEVRRVLSTGGVYAVGLSLSVPGLEQPSEDVWQARRGCVHVHQFVSYLPHYRPRRERVCSHLTVRTPGGERHIDSCYDLRCYTLAQWVRVVRRGGFEIADVVDERGRSIETCEPGYAIFVLRAGAVTGHRGPRRGGRRARVPHRGR